MDTEESHHHLEEKKEKFIIPVNFIVGIIFFVLGICIANFFGEKIQNYLLLDLIPLSFVFYFVAYLCFGFEVLKDAISGIIHLQWFDEKFLMAVATLSAFAIGEAPEAVGIMLFYQIGEYFEDRATEKSRRQIMESLDKRPEMVNIIGEDNSVSQVLAKDVLEGQEIILRPGDRIPLDAVIVDGTSTIDTSYITGESVPRGVTVGDELISGCINLDGVLKAKVVHPLEESMVTKILQAVSEASERKPKLDRFITKFSKIYTPVIVILAILVAVIPSMLFGDVKSHIYTAVTFLVISCPCALVISVPLAFFAAIGRGAKSGILFKGGATIESLSTIKAVAMDKTGTLTKGVFKVTRIFANELENANNKIDNQPELAENIKGKDLNEAEKILLNKIASLENYSTHPIGKSIVKYSNQVIDEPKEEYSLISEVSGKGISGTNKDGKRLYAGSLSYIEKSKIQVPDGVKEKINSQIGTVVVLGEEGRFIGFLVISDEIKDDANVAIKDLEANGLTPIMLTGDNEKAAYDIGEKLGIRKIFAKLLPIDKLKVVERLRKEIGNIMFVGDGINDSVVLAGSDVGAAMGSGSDTAIEAADVVFLDSNVKAIPRSYKIAEKCHSIATSNITLALVVKAVVLIMGFLGFANMWLAVFADTGVAMLCVLNSVRILRMKL
ncbi:MAG: heavy metal translocating P-type ATPase [Lachnospiraceae bacterium]|nr:heavy metal translocating P-type ATPase [Lachnospiraceae bacterium]